MNIFQIFGSFFFFTLLTFNGCAIKKTKKLDLKIEKSNKIESIVKYIDSLDINRFNGWGANYQSKNMQTHYLSNLSGEIKSSYNLYFEKDIKRFRITPRTFDFFLEKIGYNLPLHNEYIFLILHLNKDSVIVKGKDFNGIENQLDSFKLNEISSKFKNKNMFEKAYEVQKITSYVQANWAFNPKLKYWRFFLPEGQLIYFPKQGNITSESISGCEKISSKWYLHKPN